MQLQQHKGFFVLIVCTLISVSCAQQDDPLPSWNDGASKAAIVDFVTSVTAAGSDTFVPVEERVATFDNDGTLWSEQPLYFQALFALDRLQELASEHPEWRTAEPYKSALTGDIKGLMAQGETALLQVLMTPHANITAEEFADSARHWVNTATHPTTGKRYTDMVYQPMLELLDYLRANDFKVFIVSGGGIDFMRVFAEEVYGVAPEQVIGSSIEAQYELRDGIPAIVKKPSLSFIDDKAGKPVGIYSHIGRRPIFAAGNSDGDIQMLQYTTIARDNNDTTPRFGLLVHHTDGEREFAYDRQSAMGKLDQGLDEARQRGWLLVDMKNAWNRIYPGDE